MTTRTSNHNRTRARRTKARPSSEWKALRAEVKADLQQVLEFLEVISLIFTVLAVLLIYSKFGFGIAGIVVVFGYLLFWEVVGTLFSTAEKKIPRPLRMLWRILHKILEIIAPGP